MTNALTKHLPLIGSFAGGAAITAMCMRTPSWACGMFQSSLLAAWIQGVGSLLAVVAALFIPIWQRTLTLRDRRYENETRRNAIASKMLPHFSAWRTNIEFLPMLSVDNEKNNFQEFFGETTKLFEEINSKDMLVVPSQIFDRIDDLHLFNEVGTKISESIFRTMRMKQVFEIIETTLELKSKIIEIKELNTEYVPSDKVTETINAYNDKIDELYLDRDTLLADIRAIIDDFRTTLPLPSAQPSKAST